MHRPDAVFLLLQSDYVANEGESISICIDKKTVCSVAKDSLCYSAVHRQDIELLRLRFHFLSDQVATMSVNKKIDRQILKK